MTNTWRMLTSLLLIGLSLQSALASENLLATLSTTCMESSVFSNRYKCQYAYDGTILTGNDHEWTTLVEDHEAWMSIEFVQPVRISDMKLWQRCANDDQYQDLKFTFSDGSTFMANLPNACNGGLTYYNCVSNPGPDEFITISPARITTSVHIEGVNDCAIGRLHNGIREIQLIGDPCTVNDGTCTKTCGIGTMTKTYTCRAFTEVEHVQCCDQSCTSGGGAGGGGLLCTDFPPSGGR